MDDPRTRATTERPVAGEHELWDRDAAEEGSDADRRQLEELRISDGDPVAARVGPPEVVERHEQ